MDYLLSGGGDFEHFEGLDSLFASLCGKRARVQVLPYANLETDYKEIFDRVDETFANLDVQCEFKIDSLTAADLEKSKGLFIEGGNTFDLVTRVRKANLATHLSAFFKDPSKVVYADSAGAILLGKSVRTAFFGDDSDEDGQRLQDYRGLDVIDSWTLHCHYTQDDDDSVMDLVYELGTPVLALHEETGIHIAKDFGATVYGDSPVHVFGFEGRKSFRPGSSFSLRDFI